MGPNLFRLRSANGCEGGGADCYGSSKISKLGLQTGVKKVAAANNSTVVYLCCGLQTVANGGGLTAIGVEKSRNWVV